MTGSDFQVKTGEFEGPLELLLRLVEKRKLFINDISLAQIADKYISHIKEIQNFPVKDVANFIVVASTLILIKSKSLLPNLELTLEEEASIEDLEERLRQYKQAKELGKKIKERFGLHIIFPSQTRLSVPVFSPHKEINSKNLLNAIQDIVGAFPKTGKIENPKALVKKVVSLEEMINSLTERVKESFRMSFKDFAKNHSNLKGGGGDKDQKINMIVGFLAMLELVKTGLISVSQSYNFDDINMESQEVGLPRY